MIHSKTQKGFGGIFVHEDTYGRVIGTSKPNPFLPREYFHYNTDSIICGRSSPDFGGGYMHYDADRCYIGKSIKNPFGGYVHYDADGNVAGKSEEVFGGSFVNHDIMIDVFKS